MEDPLIEPGTTAIVLPIREMSSSREGFVVPDHCEAWIDLHLQPHHDPALIQAAIQQIATSAKHFIAGLDLDIAFDFASSGFNLGTANDLTQSLPAIYGL